MHNVTRFSSILVLIATGPSASTEADLATTPVQAAAVVESAPAVSAWMVDIVEPADEPADPIVEPSAITAPNRPAVELIGLTDEQTRIVNRSIGLFELAGMQLPPLVVRGDHDGSDCGGGRGVHRRHEGWSEVVLCAALSPTWERQIVVHELAHAWVASELTDERRDAFQELRGWEHWRNYELAEWHDNGTEQAAEIISWGVYDRAAPVLIDHRGCDELVDAHRTLTGADPHHGHTELCAQRVPVVDKL